MIKNFPIENRDIENGRSDLNSYTKRRDSEVSHHFFGGVAYFSSICFILIVNIIRKSLPKYKQ